jgi:hypothetical protein
MFSCGLRLGKAERTLARTAFVVSAAAESVWAMGFLRGCDVCCGDYSRGKLSLLGLKNEARVRAHEETIKKESRLTVVPGGESTLPGPVVGLLLLGFESLARYRRSCRR